MKKEERKGIFLQKKKFLPIKYFGTFTLKMCSAKENPVAHHWDIKSWKCHKQLYLGAKSTN